MRAKIIAILAVAMLGGCAAVEEFLESTCQPCNQPTPLEGNTTGGLK